jgi:hypothetical protein
MLDTCERGIERAQAMYTITKSSYWLESAKKWATLKAKGASEWRDSNPDVVGARLVPGDPPESR